MSLPPFAPVPPASIRFNLAPAEWEACLDAWLTLSEMALRVPAADFDSKIKDDGSLSEYLVSFYSEIQDLKFGDNTLRTAKTVSVLKVNFRLVKRIWTESGSVPPSLLTYDFLTKFAHAHTRVPEARDVQEVTAGFWKRKSDAVSPVLQKQKDNIIRLLESKNVETNEAMQHLARLAPIMHISFDIAAFFMTGSDFIDALISAFRRDATDSHRKAITLVVYFGLFALLKTDPPNLSLLSDHLYSLKSSDTLLLPNVASRTPLTAKIRQSLGKSIPERLSKLLITLDVLRVPSLASPKKPPKQKRSYKGKGKQKETDTTLHIHRMSLVTQIQDLFPDLGSGFVLKLLDEYNDDVEQATAHLLEESLPPHLASLDRTEQGPVYDTDPQTEIEHLAPASTPPLPAASMPERRNVFDDDEIDGLALGTSRLHIGKRNKSTEEELPPNKAAILTALAAFDSDDDERDDTYDVEDVGGTVDNAHPDGEPGPAAKVMQEENDKALFSAYKSSPELFGRTFDVRKGQARQALKAETGMTDEAIEGWAIMLQRDPKRLRRLEAQSGMFDGKQAELASTAYSESPGGTETEDSDVPQGGRGGYRGRGRGGGRGRGRGNVAGASNDPSTANAQRHKEANKSSRANHNRRDQRARKMARGGFAG